MFSACVLEFADMIMLLDSNHITSYVTSVLEKQCTLHNQMAFFKCTHIKAVHRHLHCIAVGR